MDGSLHWVFYFTTGGKNRFSHHNGIIHQDSQDDDHAECCDFIKGIAKQVITH